MKILLLLVALLATTAASYHHKCPPRLRKIIEKAALDYEDMTNQTKTIRRVLNDIHGGMWGAIISDRDADFAWTLPDVYPFFCRYRFLRWNYVLFKTSDEDVPDRYTIEDAIKEGRLLKVLSRKPRGEYHDEHNPCDPPVRGNAMRQQENDDYIVRRPNY